MLKKQWVSLKRRFVPYIVAYGAKVAMRLLMLTCRVKVKGLDAFVSAAHKEPCIVMLWHNRLVIVSEFLNKFTPQFIYRAFISKSRDGDPLALLAESYKTGRALRVPHNARHAALSQMIEHLKVKREIILITPDGPRGPRYEVKPGIVMAAKQSSAQIFPFSWNASRAWKLNTWDKMLIPKPFSTITVTFGDPLSFQDESSQDYTDETALLRSSLLNLE